MAATVFEPSAYSSMMDVDHNADNDGTLTTTTAAKQTMATSTSMARNESFMNCDFYSNGTNNTKNSMALFTRPSTVSFEHDLDAEDLMEMAELAYSSNQESYHGRACFYDMPEELVYLIFTFLHGSDICNGVQKVCRNWRRLAMDDQLWLDLLRRTQLEKDDVEEQLSKPAHKTWKWLYQSRHLPITDLARISGVTTIVGRHESADYIYEGEWKDGKHHGYGRKIWKNMKSESEAKEENGDGNGNGNVGHLAEEDGAAGAAPETNQPVVANQQQALPKGRGAQSQRRKPVLPFYEGEWKEGKEHGKGKRLFEEDHYYVGEWKEGDREGFGFYHWPNKTYYEGEFKEGFRHGHGTYTWSEKAKYVGQWQKGIEHGKGVRTWADGDRYEGDWIHGTRTGYGLYSWPNGSSYEGKWLNCAHEGYGVYKWPDGRTYKGSFSTNKKHGAGEYYWPDGAMFSGQWRNGVRHGDGTMVWPDGAKFQGEWSFDRRGDGRYFGTDSREVPQSIGASWAKKYDYYFAMPMDMWEQIYLPEINKLIRDRKLREQEEEETRRMNLEFTQKGREDPRAWGKHSALTSRS